MGKNFQERRKYARIPLVSVVKLRFDQEQPEPALLVDISAGGAKIMSQRPLSVGEEVEMSLSLYENKTIFVDGKIVWTRDMDLMKEYKFGVEYMGGIQFNKENREIDDYVKKYSM
ncbi:MAG: PilZ domain-containing protein [Vulcanimicrobiota bacterium]